MSVDTNWDIESYRTFYESEEHWVLKRDFMQAHKSRFSEPRLICLAQVYVNIELLGCRYPDKVMEQVAVLAKDIGHDYKERKKSKLQRTFVKASDAAGAKFKAAKPMTKSPKPRKRPLEEKKLFNKKKVSRLRTTGMNFVKATEEDDEEVEESDQANTASCASDPNTSGSNSMAAETIANQTVSSQHIFFSDNSQDSEVFTSASCQQSDISSATTSTPSNMNVVNKYKQAIKQVSRSSPETFRTAGAKEDQESGQGHSLCAGRVAVGRGGHISTPAKETQPRQTLDDTSVTALHVRKDVPTWAPNFVIVNRVYQPGMKPPTHILTDSAGFSRFPLNSKYDISSRTSSVLINGELIAKASACNMKMAKMAATRAALNFLSQHCYQLKVHQLHTGQNGVTVDELNEDGGGGAASSSALEPNYGMGMRLMKMMGWAGGGLGREGKGITEPVKPTEMVPRGGLGWDQGKHMNKIFRANVTKLLKDFVQGSGLSDDLTFSPEFTKGQREQIHKIAQAMKGIKTGSHGKGEQRYLVVSRKSDSKSLIQALLREGSNEKYELLPPGSELEKVYM